MSLRNAKGLPALMDDAGKLHDWAGRLPEVRQAPGEWLEAMSRNVA
jgi:hypothetical protein